MSTNINLNIVGDDITNQRSSAGDDIPVTLVHLERRRNLIISFFFLCLIPNLVLFTMYQDHEANVRYFQSTKITTCSRIGSDIYNRDGYHRPLVHWQVVEYVKFDCNQTKATAFLQPENEFSSRSEAVSYLCDEPKVSICRHTSDCQTVYRNGFLDETINTTPIMLTAVIVLLFNFSFICQAIYVLCSK